MVNFKNILGSAETDVIEFITGQETFRNFTRKLRATGLKQEAAELNKRKAGQAVQLCVKALRRRGLRLQPSDSTRKYTTYQVQ